MGGKARLGPSCNSRTPLSPDRRCWFPNWLRSRVSAKPWVAVTRADLPGGGLARLAEHARLRVWPENRPPEIDELMRLVGDARAALCVNGDPVTGKLLGDCPDLKLVVMASVGYDSVDVEARMPRSDQHSLCGSAKWRNRGSAFWAK